LKEDLASHARVSGLESLRGNSRGAIDHLRRAIASGRATSQPRESIAWAQWQLGAEHFAIGESAAAEAQFEAALRTFPGYYRALAGLAQVRVAQGRHGDAALLYAASPLRPSPVRQRARRLYADGAAGGRGSGTAISISAA
jgi:tetratricopeptide (TPR) repeat protein